MLFGVLDRYQISHCLRKSPKERAPSTLLVNQLTQIFMTGGAHLKIVEISEKAGVPPPRPPAAG